MDDIIAKLFKLETNNYVFIYTPPKVGSTTLVTSLRISLNAYINNINKIDHNYNVVHIHDEIMLNVLTGVENIKIIDVIQFLSNKGKQVYVLDIYRTPIERKMSAYFEKLSPYHFNNSEENLLKYDISRIINRFNKIFPHLENGDHYFEKYNINNPLPFDFGKKFTLQEINNVKYIKIRLCDSKLWGNILSSIFKKDIFIIDDYKTDDKGIGELYKRFKNEYRLPVNYLELIKNCKYFNFYYNETERNTYLQSWTNKLDKQCISYTLQEYQFYIQLCLENQTIYDIDVDHYIDNGCLCKHCNNKRNELYLKAKIGETKFDKIIHNEVIKEVNDKLKMMMHLEMARKKYTPNQFKINVTKN